MLNMNSIVAKLVLLIAIPFCGMSNFVNAQVGNPLRLEAVAVAPKTDQSKPGLLNRRIPQSNSHARQTQERNIAKTGMVDTSVSHAAYTSAAATESTEVAPAEIKPADQNRTQSLAEMLAEYQGKTAAKRNQGQALNPEVSGANGESESSAIGKGQTKRSDQQRLQNLIQSIAWSTCLVLAVGIGFIFSAKLWLGRSTPKEKQPESPIKIASTLRLSPKANLFLVEAGEQRLIVASDQDGIKSMVALNESAGESKSFAETLQSLSEASDSMAVQDSGLFDQGKSDIKEESEQLEPASSETYSLGTVGKSKTKAATGNDKESGDESNNESLEATQRRMEAALNEYGLKDLLLEALQGKPNLSSR